MFKNTSNFNCNSQLFFFTFYDIVVLKELFEDRRKCDKIRLRWDRYNQEIKFDFFDFILDLCLLILIKSTREKECLALLDNLIIVDQLFLERIVCKVFVFVGI